MPRFFVNPADLAGNTVTITGDDHRHIAYALRMAVGEEITVSDGEGAECLCRLFRITDAATEAEILSRRVGEGELPVTVCLYQGNPKGDKLEMITQKAVELGASVIIPFESSRCVSRIVPARVEKQTARLARVAREAAGQCGRARLPLVLPPMSFAAALADAKARADAIFFCYEEEKTVSLAAAIREARAAGATRLAFFVGSEGGFSPEEATAAQGAGAIPVSLGRRILRCETAPIFALSCLVCAYEL